MTTPTENGVPFTTVALSGVTYIDGLLGRVKWGGDLGTGVTLDYSFIGIADPTPSWDSSANGYGNPPNEWISGGLPIWSALTPDEQAAAQAALQSWANVANVTFNQVDDTDTQVGDIRFAHSTLVDTQGAAAWAYFPDSSPIAGDVWLGVQNFNNDGNPAVTPGDYDFLTIMHELGHALGLKHPHDTQSAPDPVNKVTLPQTLDTMMHTIMSYEYGYSFDFEPTTPMVDDIAAIQYLYGPNTTYNAGDTEYDFSATGQYYQTIWDAGGNDTIVYTGDTGGVIDLRPGNASQLGLPLTGITFSTRTGNTTGTFSTPKTVWIAYGAIIENATGGNGDDSLVGNDADNVLLGGAGNDTLQGGLGNDSLDGGNGNDTASYAAAGSAVSVDLLVGTATGGDGNDTLSGIENLTGSAFADQLTGNAGDNVLDGGLGNDTLTGGAGNDTYIVNAAGDVVVENASEGTDTIRSSVTWTLPANVENLVLTGSAVISGTGNGLNNNLTGNGAANSLSGGNGDDTLDGGAGNDTLTGGAGNDVYDVDNAGDVVNENPGEGTDTIRASLAWVLGANLENLVLTGSAAINGTGNELDNQITGNAGDNVLDGGAGNDTLMGGAGNDTYVVDSSGDVVTENAAQGTDTVRAAVNWSLGANLENLVLTGTGDFSGAGNSLDNVLMGNAGANSLSGGDGADTLQGMAGDDVLDGGNGSDVLSGDAGNDSLSGGNGDDALSGADGNDSLLGGIGNDLLDGAQGNDFLSGGNGDDELHGGQGDDGLYGGRGDDLLFSGNGLNYVSGDEGSDTLVGGGDADSLLGGNGDDLLSGEAGDDSLSGGAGNDSLSGADGADTLSGGADNDTLSGDGGGDAESGGNGDDQLRGAQGADGLYGDDGNDYLFGGKDADFLDGGTGDDSLYGGDGFDSLQGGEGNDILWGGLNGDTLSGGNGDDSLNGETGHDSLEGNAGNDSLVGAFGNDEVRGGQGDDDLRGSRGADILVGGQGADTLNGGMDNDVLWGSEGNDWFMFDQPGGAFGSGVDRVMDFTPGEDLLVFAAGVDGTDIAAAPDVLDHLSSDGAGGTLIDLGPGNSIDLVDIDPLSLSAGDFLIT